MRFLEFSFQLKDTSSKLKSGISFQHDNVIVQCQKTTKAPKVEDDFYFNEIFLSFFLHAMPPNATRRTGFRSSAVKHVPLASDLQNSIKHMVS